MEMDYSIITINSSSDEEENNPNEANRAVQIAHGPIPTKAAEMTVNKKTTSKTQGAKAEKLTRTGFPANSTQHTCKHYENLARPMPIVSKVTATITSTTSTLRNGKEIHGATNVPTTVSAACYSFESRKVNGTVGTTLQNQVTVTSHTGLRFTNTCMNLLMAKSIKKPNSVAKTTSSPAACANAAENVMKENLITKPHALSKTAACQQVTFYHYGYMKDSSIQKPKLAARHKMHGATNLEEPTVKKAKPSFAPASSSGASNYNRDRTKPTGTIRTLERSSSIASPRGKMPSTMNRVKKNIQLHVNRKPLTKLRTPSPKIRTKVPELPTIEDDKLVEEVENDELYDCNCCYNTVYFDYLVQCQEGHLFCCECLQRYTHESVFGSGKAMLRCMSDGCTAQFARSQLIRALPSQLYEKYESRVTQESLSLAELPNFVKCHHCDAGGELEENVQFFYCPNPLCQQIGCRYCNKPWDVHKGLHCNQIEEQDETQIRVKYEEMMAESKIRQCVKCKAKFTKEDGCNKITCRCGATMCYICRIPNIDYKHFCQHLRSPKKQCKTCKSCFLWSDGAYDEELAIAELKNQANQARINKGFEVEKEIGVPTAAVN